MTIHNLFPTAVSKFRHPDLSRFGYMSRKLITIAISRLILQWRKRLSYTVYMMGRCGLWRMSVTYMCMPKCELISYSSVRIWHKLMYLEPTDQWSHGAGLRVALLILVILSQSQVIAPVHKWVQFHHCKISSLPPILKQLHNRRTSTRTSVVEWQTALQLTQLNCNHWEQLGCWECWREDKYTEGPTGSSHFAMGSVVTWYSLHCPPSSVENIP